MSILSKVKNHSKAKRAAYIAGGILAFVLIPGSSFIIGAAWLGHYITKKESEEVE